MSKENTLMNEEDIRVKLLLPFLNSLGFDASEISVEDSFSIRLGKSTQIMRGRSDILCKRNGQNLFIVELKKDTIKIDKDDIDQGISYARLLEGNIAPFTIITNGNITRIFDTISKKELIGSKISEQSDFWKNDCTLSTDVDIQIRYLALKSFISFSSENLKLFCKNQVQDRMGPLVGNLNDSSAKFVKELFISRLVLKNTFVNFLNSEESVFAIVGSAGVGKSNTMCALALEHLEYGFVFFYNAALLKRSPLEHIANDLNIIFSSKTESNLVLNKLDEIGKSLNKNILLFIDAIDESADVNISLELSEIALTIRRMTNIKLCISCKSSIWKNFLFVRDTKTHLYEELIKFHTTIVSVDNCPGLLLEDFSDEELKNIIPIYKNAFDFRGEISASLLHELKNGFFLRIFSEVYSGKQIPKKINDKDLIGQYITQSLGKTDIDPRLAIKTLAEIGKILMSYNFSSIEQYKDQGLEINNLLDQMDLPSYASLPKELFTRNILIKSNKEDSYTISFYYSKIRDYIICFHTYKLDKLDDNSFYNVLNEFYNNYIGESAIAFYMENASNNHTNAFIKYKKDKAIQYVTHYNSYLDENFKHIKDFFDPNTTGEIGIILPDDILNKDGYALVPLQENCNSKIQFANLQMESSDDYLESVFFQKGVQVVYGSNKTLLKADQSIIIKQNIFKQLKKIIEKGGLNAYTSDVLNMEKVATILYFYSDKLGYNYKLDDFNLPRFQFIYPIDLKLLKDRVYKFRARYHYKEEKIDSAIIDEMVEKALEENFDIPKMNVGGDFLPFEELFAILNILLQKGYNVIDKHHLPCPDKSIPDANERNKAYSKENYHYIRINQFSEAQGKLYVSEFFRHLEICYREFVEYCFPTFKDQFEFYTTLPHEYFFYMRESDILKWGLFGYRTSNTGKIEINLIDGDNSQEAFKKHDIQSLRSFSLDLILHIADSRHYPVRTVDRIKTSDVDRYCVMRNWVYKLLEYDLKALFKENED